VVWPVFDIHPSNDPPRFPEQRFNLNPEELYQIEKTRQVMGKLFWDPGVCWNTGEKDISGGIGILDRAMTWLLARSWRIVCSRIFPKGGCLR